MDLVDEGIGDSTEAKATAEHGAVRFHVFQCFGGGRVDFVDFGSASCGGEGAGEENGLENFC